MRLVPTPSPSIGAFDPRKAGDRVLIEAAAGEDRHVGKPAGVEDAAHAARQRDEIAGVETNAADGDALGLEPRRQRHDLPRRRFGVVGVEQQDEIVGARLREGRERRRLVGERLDEGMRHRAVERDAEIAPGEHGGGAGKAGDIARARRHQPGLGAMRAPQAEIDQQLAGRGQHARAPPWRRSAFADAGY